MKSKVAIQKDVAQLANVSQAAVSVVLSGATGSNIVVSPALRKRILDAAAELNYRTNLNARAIRQSKVFHIGYFVATSDQTDFDFAPFRAGVYDAASELGYHIVLVRMPNPAAMQIDSVPRIFRSHNLAGLVINEIIPLPANVRLALRNLSAPIVYLNNRYPTNCVCVDDVFGGTLATSHLIEQGFRKIAFLQYHMHRDFPAHESEEDRRSAYAEVMRTHHLPHTFIDYNMDDASALRKILRSPDRPEAFVCYEDYTAIHAQRYFCEARLEIGKDLALVGYNEDTNVSLSFVPLTTVQIPRYEMATAAMRMCISLIEGEKREYAPVVLKPSLIVRQSSLKRTAAV
ncbi:MAG: LacI family DNA-binding transcriptional regulator [Candidatus Methylacidiphilales bacterium]|nr:LacI family DNA-binding transcriptional regulator [Candidatus Methylacidiphilales bacterium]